MVYSTFLTLMSQLAEGGKARAVLDDQVLYLERSQEPESWLFSMPLGDVALDMRACFSSHGAFRFNQKGGAVLRLEAATGLVYAEQKVKMPWKKYLAFRQHLTFFLQEAALYRQQFIQSNRTLE